MEQIVNQAAKLRFMLGGAVSVPLVMRFPSGSGTGAAAQHSQSLEAWFAHVPGLKVVQPSTPHDAKGCLLAAIADPDPVMIFEHKLLYKMKGEVPEGHYTVPLGKARLCRPGRDVTIVATSIMVHRSLAAAEELADEGIEAEVIDLRSLRPLDREAIAESVKHTHRLVCVYEGVKTLGIGAELSASIAESEAFDFLDAPILRLGGAECPIPYNPDLEKAAVPQTPGIVAAVRRLVRGSSDRCVPTEVILPRVDMDMARRPHLALVCRGGRERRQGPADLRDRNRQGRDGGRGSGFRRDPRPQREPRRAAARRQRHRLDRRGGRRPAQPAASRRSDGAWRGAEARE